MTEFRPFFDLIIGPAGAIALLMLTVVGVVRGWWYAGSYVRKMIAEHESREQKLEADRDRWQEMALGLLQTTDKAVTMVEKPLA